MSIGPELKKLGGQVSHLEHQVRTYKQNAERFKRERDQARAEVRRWEQLATQQEWDDYQRAEEAQ